jgi:hypothetical protein
MKRTRKTALCTVGSGNVFADLKIQNAGYLQRRALAGAAKPPARTSRPKIVGPRNAADYELVRAADGKDAEFRTAHRPFSWQPCARAARPAAREPVF